MRLILGAALGALFGAALLWAAATLIERALAGAAHDAALIEARQAHCRGTAPCW